MAELVLDAWAIMAWLRDRQPAAQRVRFLLDAAGRQEQKLAMNIVNLGEVFYVSVKLKNLAYAERVLENLRHRIMIVSAPDELVLRAAMLKARHAISYADAFAVSTAILRRAPLVTGDPELGAMAAKEEALKLEWIGS